MIEFTADLEPVPFKRVMTCGKRRFNDTRYSEFKRDLALVARIAMQGRAPLCGKIKLTVVFYKLRPHDLTSRNWGDLDNHIKALLDALNGIAFQDDSQITEITALKQCSQPRIHIRLEAIHD